MPHVHGVNATADSQSRWRSIGGLILWMMENVNAVFVFGTERTQ